MQQGKFWEYHDKAFRGQKALTKDSPLAFATELGMDVDKFKGCLAKDDAKKYVDATSAEGKRVGVSSTPAVFLNGVKISGGFEQFEKELKAIL